FELRPHVPRADDLALCVACQLAGDVDRLTGTCDRDDVRIGGLSLLHADAHARRLDPVDLHGRVLSRSRCSSPPRMPLRSWHCNRAKLPTLGIPQRLEAGHETVARALISMMVRTSSIQCLQVNRLNRELAWAP